MWLSFWSSNIHFAIEFLGAIVLFLASWLLLDTWFADRGGKIFLQASGFLLFSAQLVIHSLSVQGEIIVLSGMVCGILGLLFILISLLLEQAPKIPTFGLVLVLPSVATINSPFLIAVTVLLVFIAISSGKKYFIEKNSSMKCFFSAFTLFALSSIIGYFAINRAPLDYLVIGEHTIKFGAYMCLGVWVWQYLRMRLKEELLLIFVGMALFIAMIVTFTFTALFLGNMEYSNTENLTTNVKMFGYTLEEKKDKALASAELVAKNGTIANAIAKNDFASLDKNGKTLASQTGFDFIIFADKKGNIIQKINLPTKKGESIKNEIAGAGALAGKSLVSMEETASENFGIRAASPVISGDHIIGVVIGGFILDNAFTDGLKEVTGLEATIFKGDERVATTLYAQDGKNRYTDTVDTNSDATQKVLQNGEIYAGAVNILDQDYLAAYSPIIQNEKAVGMLQVAKPQTDILEVANQSNQLTLFATIIIMLVTITPAYFIAKMISEQ